MRRLLKRVNTTHELRNRALRYLSRRSHSRYQLEQKLLRGGTSDTVQPVLDQLEKAGYLNDQEYALGRASHLRQTRHLGDLRISADLKSCGISATIISYVLLEVGKRRPQEESLRYLVETWAAKKGKPGTLAQVKRLYDHCHRRGFPRALIRQFLETLFEDIE